MAACLSAKTLLDEEDRDEEEDNNEVEDAEDWEEEEGALIAHPLLSPHVSLPSILEACTHDKQTYGFDIKATGELLQLDFYAAVRCINWLRREVNILGASAESPLTSEAAQGIIARLQPGASFLIDDAFLQPTLDNDVFLQHIDEYIVGKSGGSNWDDVDGEEDDDEVAMGRGGGVDVSTLLTDTRERSQNKAKLEQENIHLREQIATLRAQLAVASDLAKRNLESGSEEVLESSSASGSASTREADDSDEEEVKPDTDTYYFNSYSHIGIHETMLRDEERTGGYARAIFDNPELFAGKTVLDVGCGSGVLSMFAARAGATKVIGIDCSSIIFSARKNVELNGLQSVVKLVYGKCEDLSRAELGLGPAEVVDVIVSEWMGYGLLYESMLPSVIHARDSLMRREDIDHESYDRLHPFVGTMWPNRACLYINGWSDNASSVVADDSSTSPQNQETVRGAARLNWWKDVHGINLSALAPMLLTEPSIEVVRASEITTSRAILWDVDLNAVADSDLDFEVPFELTLMASDDSDDKKDGVLLDGFVVAFDVAFLGPQACVHLKTGADTPPTHWKQALFLLDPVQAPPKGSLTAGDTVTGSYAMRRSKHNPRDYVIGIAWKTGDFEGAQTYSLSS